MVRCALQEGNRKINIKRLLMWMVSLISSMMIHLFKNGAEEWRSDELVVVVVVDH